jgi:hypothetical protein
MLRGIPVVLSAGLVTVPAEGIVYASIQLWSGAGDRRSYSASAWEGKYMNTSG